MKKFTDLTTYLNGTGMIQKNKMDQWVENIAIKLKGRYDGTRVLLHTMEYRAVFSIERFEYQKHSIELFGALLVTWLSENDDRGELADPDPNVIVDVLDDDTADVEITLQFEEDVYITESENGVIQFAGKRWSLEEGAHNIAERASVVAYG